MRKTFWITGDSVVVAKFIGVVEPAGFGSWMKIGLRRVNSDFITFRAALDACQRMSDDVFFLLCRGACFWIKKRKGSSYNCRWNGGFTEWAEKFSPALYPAIFIVQPVRSLPLKMLTHLASGTCTDLLNPKENKMSGTATKNKRLLVIRWKLMTCKVTKEGNPWTTADPKNETRCWARKHQRFRTNSKINAKALGRKENGRKF